MRKQVSTRVLAALGGLALLITVGCAPEDDGSDSEPQAGGSTCAVDQLNLVDQGRLTIATDSPAYQPWFVGNDPSNGKGFESAVAYAVADELGFDQDQVRWVVEPFNKSYAPGSKDFDFDINQISINAAREKAVDFSDGYYTAAQGVIVPKGSQFADATSLADLKDARIGAQIGTTSLLAAQEEIDPNDEVFVYDDTNAAKQAFANGQIDAIVADLPTAFYITAVEIPDSVIVGQFQAMTGQPEQFGLLFEQGNPLVTCVNEALGRLKESGQLDQIEQRWLSNVTDVPELS